MELRLNAFKLNCEWISYDSTSQAVYKDVTYKQKVMSSMNDIMMCCPDWYQRCCMGSVERSENALVQLYLRPISWLFMAWFLAMPVQLQQNNELCVIILLLIYLQWGSFLTTCITTIWKNDKCNTYIYFIKQFRMWFIDKETSAHYTCNKISNISFLLCSHTCNENRLWFSLNWSLNSWWNGWKLLS